MAGPCSAHGWTETASPQRAPPPRAPGATPKAEKQASLALLLPSLDPLLQQVLVVAVGPGTQGEHAQVGEAAAVGVDEHGHQPIQLPMQGVHAPRHLVCGLLGQMVGAVSGWAGRRGCPPTQRQDGPSWD